MDGYIIPRFKLSCLQQLRGKKRSGTVPDLFCLYIAMRFTLLLRFALAAFLSRYR
jgi:hypothetical protein